MDLIYHSLGRRVIKENLAGTRLSRLMLTLSNPAATNAGRCRDRVTPFVVIDTDSIPVIDLRSPGRGWVQSERLLLDITQVLHRHE